jgi:hypothetical protein
MCSFLILFGVGDSTGSLKRIEMSGTSPADLATFDGGTCQYMTFVRPSWLFWTMSDGRLYKFNTAATGAGEDKKRFELLCCFCVFVNSFNNV